ncbi:hypothetical protein E2C01_091678 [Portunus trituberculatus]|uniref:Uncharacterized protein n=1 Tax=Portunus trituberculatus TaxID=210409 RepID=A0A5B7JI55_PORTR|nr:hypothetical protein [Portunus trituberculatus]
MPTTSSILHSWCVTSSASSVFPYGGESLVQTCQRVMAAVEGMLQRCRVLVTRSDKMTVAQWVTLGSPGLSVSFHLPQSKALPHRINLTFSNVLDAPHLPHPHPYKHISHRNHKPSLYLLASGSIHTTLLPTHASPLLLTGSDASLAPS